MVSGKRKSYLTNLIVFYDKIIGFVVRGEKWM